MANPIYVRFEMPKELMNHTYEAVEVARDTGKVRKGVNEVTKLVERGQAKLVVVAMDVQPPEILAHIPMLCEEKNTPFSYVASKQELGVAAGLKVPTSAIAVIDAGKGKQKIDELAAKLSELAK